MAATQIASFKYQFTTFDWRRGRDSSPRWPLSHNGFQDRRDRPLCPPSEGSGWQGGRDSNPQPTVLETATLPIELPPYASGLSFPYATTSETRPAPMVRPPSRIANRWPFSIATGAISLISTDTLSPGMTISTPV